MGRLASITHPTADDVAWNQTLLSFAKMTASEYGIPTGHWKQVVHTGNGYAVTYFDAMWRPLVTEHYDSGNKSGTLSQSVQRYDAEGRTIFTSYPVNNLSSYATVNTGIDTSYDALDRVIRVQQDSDPDPPITTTTTYLPGFETRVTNPRGYSTTTSYQAYGEPTTQWPESITAPEGQLTVILSDAFGKPLSITRTGIASGSPEVTRSYVYDSNQQLCKRIEPETGATLVDYDSAGNIVWSAPGTALTSGTCDRGSVAANQKITRAYDPRNRLTSVSYPDGLSTTLYGYDPDGAWCRPPTTMAAAWCTRPTDTTNGGCWSRKP